MATAGPGMAMVGAARNPADAFDAADDCHGNREWAAAIEHYTTAAKFFRRGQMAAACHDRCGSCLAELDKPQEAIKCHTKAIELAPNMMTAWHNRGHAYLQVGDHKSAVENLEKALRLEHSEETARVLEHAMRELQCPPRARDAFHKALDAYGLSEWNIARLMFEDALEQRHTRPGRCLNGLGLTYVGLGQLERALQAFDSSIDAESDNPRAWHNRSQVKAKLGRDAEARAEAMMASTLSTKHPCGGHTGRTTAGHLLELRQAHPDNIALQAFDPAFFRKLEPARQNALLCCLRNAIENPDTRVGCYACHSEDYDRFKPFFQRVVATYHNVALGTIHRSDWSLQGLPELPSSGLLDLIEFGLPPMSVRVRAARNLSGFPLPADMSQQERCKLEATVLKAFEKLIESTDYGGKYHSFTPGHSHSIPPAEYQALLNQRLVFRDMSADKSLLSAGIAKHWPFGRGVYISEDQSFVVWVGEQDHLRIICTEKTTLLNQVFDRLCVGLQKLSASLDGEYAVSEDFGMITSCPTNVGTGLRASVHMHLPNLSRDGTDIEEARSDPTTFIVANVRTSILRGFVLRNRRIAATLELSVRGVRGGRGHKAGRDGTVDISPTARFGTTEAQILWSMYKGVQALQVAEEAAAEQAQEARRKRANEKEMERHKAYMAEQQQQRKALQDSAATQIQARWRGVETRAMVSVMVEDELAKAKRMQEKRRKDAELAAAEAAAAAAQVAEAARLERLKLQEAADEAAAVAAAAAAAAAAAEQAEQDRKATEEEAAAAEAATVAAAAAAERDEQERQARLAAEQAERDRRMAEEEAAAAAAAAQAERERQKAEEESAAAAAAAAVAAEQAERDRRTAEEEAAAAAAEQAERNRQKAEEEAAAAAAEQAERDRRMAEEESTVVEAQAAEAAAAEALALERVREEEALAKQRQLDVEEERIRVEKEEAEAARLKLEDEARIAAEAEAARLAAEEEETRERRRLAAERKLAEDEAARVAEAEAAAAQSALREKLAAKARDATAAEELSAEQFYQKVQDELNAALTEDLPFGKNSGAMLDAGPQMLVGVAAVLQSHPYVTILVDGHSNGKKNTPFLQKLSEKRAISVKNELVAQGVRPDHIQVKGSGADGRGGHVFITVSKIDLEAAGVACAPTSPERSFASQLEDMMLSPEQQAKKDMLDHKVKQLRLRMMAMMAAKQAALPAEGDGEVEGCSDGQE